MFSLEANDEILSKLKEMWEDEDDEDICIRLREYTIGSGWHAKIMLGLGMEEMDEDEDEKIMVGDLPFIAEKDFLLKYGQKFSLSFNDDKQLVLTALAAE